jgi:hypothetical protein
MMETEGKKRNNKVKLRGKKGKIRRDKEGKKGRNET